MEFSQYHFQWHTQPYAGTTFLILLLHTSCIRPNGCSNILYRVFSFTLSLLTYCNHSLCAEHSPHVFHISYIYWDILMINFSELVFKACSCVADSKLSVSRFKFPFLSQCHDFPDILSSVSLPHWPCSFILLNCLFFLVLFCYYSPFYLQFYLFLIFLTLLQLSVILLHYLQDKNLYFLILRHNILPHWSELTLHTYVWYKSSSNLI